MKPMKPAIKFSIEVDYIKAELLHVMGDYADGMSAVLQEAIAAQCTPDRIRRAVEETVAMEFGRIIREEAKNLLRALVERELRQRLEHGLAQAFPDEESGHG